MNVDLLQDAPSIRGGEISCDMARSLYRAVEIIELSRLIPHEEVDVRHAERVAANLQADGFWFVPIAIEDRCEVVMDGHHRLYAASLLSLSCVPVVRWSYDDVLVTTWEEGNVVDPAELIAAARQRRLLPSKSTRHAFPGVSVCKIALSDLGTASSQRF